MPSTSSNAASACSGAPDLPVPLPAPNDNPDLNAQLYNVIRTMLAAKFEGDMCAWLMEIFGKLLRRGEELSSLDAGLLLFRTGAWAGLELILGIDIKTAVMSESWFKQGENQSDLAWRAQIASQPSQRQCDVFLIGWPLLRHLEYWTILVDDIEKSPRLRFYTSGLSTWIEPVVPPALWPLTVRKSQIATILESKRRDKAARWRKLAPRKSRGLAADLGDLPTGWHTTKDLLYNNVDSSNYRPFVTFLSKALSTTGNPVINVSSTRYQPYTSDLHFEIGQDEQFFMEIKFGYAAICEGPETQNGTLPIRHDSGLSLYGRPAVRVFSPTSGRWPMLLTEVSLVSERIKVEGGMIPRKMALVPRSLRPVAGTQNTSETGLAEEILFEIPARNIIDFRHDVAQQLSLLLCEVYREELRLPPLESLRDILPERVVLPVKTQIEDDHWDISEHGGDGFAGTDLARDLVPAELRRKHAVQRQFQARSSLLLLQQCCKVRAGLIFDYQRDLGLRSYAFAGYKWSDTDVAFTKSRPRCSPVEIFELSAHLPFVFLSFTTVNCRAHDRKFFLHPSILQQLCQEARADTTSHRRRILILATSDNISASIRTRPVYAIPTSIIHYEDINVDFQNHSRWRNIQLSGEYDMDDFRFDDLAEFIRYLLNVMETADRRFEMPISFHGIRVQRATRDDIFDEILPGFQTYVE